jgi:cellulose synthase/poly-beta-1,6-N-acetylglucosamine synthase-like glycosyltransferase
VGAVDALWEPMTIFLFWLFTGLVFFAYGGYSMVIFLLARIYRRPLLQNSSEPMVTMLITAYNEAGYIGTKLQQTLQLDYPADKLEVIVASDGSTDDTDSIAQSFSDCGVRLIRVEGRVGKTQTQNVAVAHANGDIVIFSDATTRYDRAAIGLGSILFWRYENAIKRMQTQISTITGCCGCIYSLRRLLYCPLPADVISDLVEPLKILEGGHRVVFEPEAIAYEETTESAEEEFKMRVRVVGRGMRGLLYVSGLLNPLRHPFVAFQLLSHKVLRWLVPLFLLGILSTSTALSETFFYKVVLILQLVFYALAAAGLLLRRSRSLPILLSLPMYFITLNAAASVALWRTIRGRYSTTWETVRR